MICATHSDSATGWMTGVRFPAGAGIFFFFATASRPAVGLTQLSTQWVPARDAGHSPPSSAEVNALNYTSTPPYVLMAWCLTKHRYVFTLWYSVKKRNSFTFSNCHFLELGPLCIKTLNLRLNTTKILSIHTTPHFPQRNISGTFVCLFI